MIAYFNGNFIKEEEVKISRFDRGFQFADGVYEVMRTYNGKIFKIYEHIKRLTYSLNEIKIKNFDSETIYKIIEELISRNDLKKDFNIYIQITRGVPSIRMHAFPSGEVKPTVYISIYPLISHPKENEKGIKVQLEKDIRWTRCDIKSISLLPSILANQSARENGANEAVFVRDGVITEGSHTNFFAVKGNILYTPPLSNFILAGITRGVIIEICRNKSIELYETNIKEQELKYYDEFFISGTSTEIKPVFQIDNWLVKNGEPGRMTRRIQQEFFEYVKKVCG